MALDIRPLTFAQAKSYILEKHRHHKPPISWKFGIGCFDGNDLVGVVCVGRPVARMLDNGLTCEVTRLCTNGTRNACSMLYGAARRCALAMGYKRIITYILESEPGTSLKASGWRFVKLSGGGSWSRPSRGRKDKHPLDKKQLWEAVA